MKRNGVLLTLLTVISLPLFLYQNLTANVGCVERGETQQSNPKSKTCGEQSRTIQNPKLDKKEFVQKTMKLHMPFIANNGQMDERVKFYAKTFSGTVFVTKEGEIVYALPANSSECRGEWYSPNGIHNEVGTLHNHHISDIVHPASWIVDHDKSVFQNLKSATKNDALCHPECNEGSLVSKRDSSPSAQNDREESEFHNPLSYLSGVSIREALIGTDSPLKRGTHTRPLLVKGRNGVALKEEFVGAKVKAIQGEEPSVTKVNYFKGNDTSKWKTNISTYDFVNLGEIYKGIELKLKAYGNNIEKLFTVKPDADTETIQLKLSGAKALKINKDGQLEVRTELGPVKFTRPVAYQEIEGKLVEVDVEYSIQNPEDRSKRQISSREKGMGRNGKYLTSNLQLPIQNLSSTSIGDPQLTNSDTKNPHAKIRNLKLAYGFKVASYDKTKDLVIDPLLASTYVGGADWDKGSAITLDASGNVYVTGDTYSTAFPTTSGAYDTSQNGSYDVFISKLDGGLTSLLASTFWGGSNSDTGYAVTLDASGNVYVTGNTYSSDFPTTSGTYDNSYNGYSDVFISKLDSGLTSLLASTYLGGTLYETGSAIALDTGGNVYVTGWTHTENFPTTDGAYDTSTSAGNGAHHVFISKLDGGLTSLLASTFLQGSDGADYGNAIALDSSGNVYVSGDTDSSDFPTTSGAYDTSFSDDYEEDVFISKLNGGLTSLLASTYLGGNFIDTGYTITLDASGNVYVMGYTYSSDFPTTSGAYDTSYNYNGSDVFVSKLNSGLTSLLTSTFLGGSGWEFGNAIALDASGNVYVTGDTDSSNFPTTSGAYDTSYNGGIYDVFISKLNSGLTNLLFSTYLGGFGDEYGNAIALDASGNVYVTGNTYSSDFPTTSGAYDTSYNGGDYDVFISKLDGNLSKSITSTPTPTSTATKTPTPTPTPTPTECEPESIEASPSKLTLDVNESGDVVVAVTGEGGCPVEGETVTATINKSGQKRITISPTSATTDADGEAMFTITAKNKAGNATVTFKQGKLKTKVKIKVVK